MTASDRTDRYDAEVAVSIRSLFELTSRIDERVKLLFETSSKTDDKFNQIMKCQNEIMQRVTALESKNGTEIKKSVEELNNRIRTIETQVQSIDFITKGHQTRWDKIMDNGMKLLVAIAAAFIIWRAGW